MSKPGTLTRLIFYSLHNIIKAMNAAILNADLPISVRMKRANRRGWMLDRRDNIKFLVQGAQAYRQLAAQLAWEGTFEQNRNQPAPFTTFGQHLWIWNMKRLH